MAEGNTGIWGWDLAFNLWRKVLVDGAGNLQVDVLGSALPAGAATAANQVTEITALQLIDDLRNALGSVNTDDLQVDIKDIADGEIKCYGYDGANWQTLLVESAALKNLRVRLYDGANGIDSHLADASGLAPTERGIMAIAMNYGNNGLAMYCMGTNADAVATDGTGNRQNVMAMLMGYNGATWDRLRVCLLYTSDAADE